LSENYTTYSLALLISLRELIALYSFFFYRYVAHLYLHSFPTRRSSDLKCSRNVRKRYEYGIKMPVSFFRAVKIRCGFSGGCPFIDRKSTRLNSSHVSISYAVFCLKKKKTSNVNTTRNTTT